MLVPGVYGVLSRGVRVGMKFCTKCGRSLNEDARFCTGCGAPFPDAEEAVPVASGGRHRRDRPGLGGRRHGGGPGAIRWPRPDERGTPASHQKPTASVNGSESCTDWRISLYLEQGTSGYIIGKPPSGYHAKYAACP